MLFAKLGARARRPVLHSFAKEEACEGGLANGTHCRSSALYPGAWKLALTDEQRRQGAAI
jgi:hypothetical protein